MSRGPRANRPGSAHGVPFVGMRGSLPRAPACAGARFSGLRRRSRMLAGPLRRGWRPRWRGLHSHPLLLAVCVPTGRDPRPVPSYLPSLPPGVNRQCGGGCTALHEPRNRGASTSHSAFEQVGRQQTLRSDFRLVAATNRNLAQAIGEGRFREDLFYRLNVARIEVPSLRAHRSDIPDLAEHFLRQHGLRAHDGPKRAQMPLADHHDMVRAGPSDCSNCFETPPSSSEPLDDRVAKFGRGRSDRCSSLCSTPPRSHARTFPSSPLVRKTRRGLEARNSSRKPGRRPCRST